MLVPEGVGSAAGTLGKLTKKAYSYTIGQQLKKTLRNLHHGNIILRADRHLMENGDLATLDVYNNKVMKTYRELLLHTSFIEGMKISNLRAAHACQRESNTFLQSTIRSSTEAYQKNERATRTEKELQTLLRQAMRGELTSNWATTGAGSHDVSPSDISLVCQWTECDCKESFPDAEALYDHLVLHVALIDTKKLLCAWQGCLATWTKRDEVLRHLRNHAPTIPLNSGPVQDPYTTAPESGVAAYDIFGPRYGQINLEDNYWADDA
ncbi:hypothetical protein B0H11DRAFT_1317251 [Mycena galericulata]|nr:hypothetical protein B0H11DRAFT_1317251 [Mycena galericulata]